MLIKEYRIPMPLSVEEYRIAQLYMIQVKPYHSDEIKVHIPGKCVHFHFAAYTCPFVEKFSIDIETYYKSDTGNQADVFNLSLAERRQRTLDPIDIVKDPIPPHEYKAEEDPRIYRSIKTSRGPLNDDWIEEFVKDPSKSPVMCAYKLCKVEFRYWGMQSKIERFIHDVGLRKVMVRAHRQAWCWQDEWYGLTMEDIRQLELETQLALAQKMAQYAEEATEKSRETQDTLSPSPGQEVVGVDTLQARGTLTKQWSTSSRSSRSSKRGVSPSQQSISEWRMQSIARDSEDNSDDEFFDDELCPESLQSSKIHVLILVLHGGNILDTGCGEQSSKQGDVNTITSAFDTVMHVHYPSALGHVAIRLVPCPPICAEAFSLVSNLSPYSYDEGCLSSSQDHIPLAALPLLATSSPQYQDAVATVISRANQVYSDFLRSLDGASFSGQVCLIGDCVGGILGFDALCSSSQTVCESQSSSRRGSFHLLPPFNVPRYQRFPLGDGNSALLADIVHTHGGVFMESSYPSSPLMAPQCLGPVRRASEVSIASQVSGMADSYTASNIANIAARWWGTKRLDFALYCPDALTAFPTVALPHLFHASYWESTDVVSFLLRQVMRHESSSVLELHGREVSEFTPSRPREKWMRKRTHVKIRNVTANHRVNDAVFTEDAQKVVTGRFMYGPLDMVTLAGEKVDILIMTQPPSGEWEYLHTEVTNSSGRISYTISEQEGKRLGVGVYPIKMVVRGDHTFADSYLTVLPPATEFVVFSIDGSFAASVSIMGSDPKVRAGAVDVVRHWQDLGYVIIYVTGRPDMQKQRVVAWLSQHNFPHGIVSFCDGLVHDPLRHKANFLKSLITEAQMKACAGYGSTKDISVYTSVGLSPSQIYIVGRPSKKMQHQCQFITDGYAAHLSQLEYTQRSRPAKASSTRMVLRKASFGLGANTDFLRKRNHVLRSMSSQPTASSPTSVHMKPERTQSQSDGERMQTERVERGQAQRSMSLAAGCWGRSSTSKLESRWASGY
uniref:Phosphatidylinositol transfer protein membrane associated 2 n=1 Tax=Astyanax mexicanus TaxID=7994 RepID=A0A8B9RFR0_ASTMX